MDGLRVGVTKKEIAARAVLRDVWQSGHRCVELQQDGRALVFFCTLCSIRCYSDATLADHLRGNQHARRLANAPVSSFHSVGAEDGLFTDDERVVSAGKGKSKIEVAALSKSCFVPDSMGPFPASSLEWIGSGQVYLKEGLSELSQHVQQVWCQWFGRNGALDMVDSHTNKKPEELAHAVVVFPYSDAIGRQGDWKPGCFLKKGEAPYKDRLRLSELRRKTTKLGDPNSLSSQDLYGKEGVLFSWEPTIGEEEGPGSLFLKDLSQKALRKALKRRRLNMLERLCFICHQQMFPGKDVAALLNSKTGQMMCSSRNERGAFHVFHTSCLIDWILLCESKFWSTRVKKDTPRMRGQMNKKPRRGKAKATIQSCGPIFCPECQGTGVEIHDHQLEQPRYRLAQVFDWILEIIQARRSWISHASLQHKKCRGLLFASDAQCRDTSVSLGSLEFYAAGSLELLASVASTKLLPHGA